MQAPISVNDLFLDGFLSNTFSPQDAHDYFAILLRTPNFLQHHHISYAQGIWYIRRAATSLPEPPSQNVFLPLDYSIKLTQGSVVPQRRWTPTDEVDIRRYVEGATLQLPIFFIHQNGGVGFWLPDVLQGRVHDLCNRDGEAPLGGVTTTHIRINWPGCSEWKRQIPARDETYGRNPITLGRFMKHVSTSVDKFFNQCTASNQTNGRWAIGPHGITQHHVKIIGAVHVSAASWMPIIQLTRYVL